MKVFEKEKEAEGAGGAPEPERRAVVESERFGFKHKAPKFVFLWVSFASEWSSSVGALRVLEEQ